MSEEQTPPVDTADREPDRDGPPPGVATMAVLRWVLVAVMAVIAALSIAYATGHVHADMGGETEQYYCPMHPQVVQDQPGECPICSMSLVPKPKSTEASPTEQADTAVDHAGHRHEPTDAYYCPMHPEETGTDANARCPLCKMKLELKPTAAPEVKPKASPAPKPKATHADASPVPSDLEELPKGVPGLVPVQLALDRVQLIGMRTANVTREALTPELQAVGYVAPDESKFARVHARFSGWVEKLAVATAGARVRRGQVLANIYNLELLPAQQEFLATRKWSAEAAPGGTSSGAMTASLAADARKRLELLGMSPAEVDRIAATGAPSRTVAVVAPIGGTVMRKDVVEGSYIQPGTQLFEIADLSKVWVIAEIYEHEMSRVAQGQVARFETQAYPGQPFAGKVAFLYPTVDATTRTLRIRIELDNKESELRPGMYGNVSMQLGHAEAVVMPVEALVDTGEHQYVFLAKDKGRFEPRRIQTGARVGDKVQVLRGLSEGDVVVTTANFLLDSESRLRATIESVPPN